MNGTFYPTGDLLDWANNNHKTTLASFASTCTNLPSTGNFDVIRLEHGGFLASMLAIRQSDRKMFISTYNTVKWSDWSEYVTNSDSYTKIVDANFVNGEASITINDIDVTKYSWSAVGRAGVTIITSVFPQNTNTLKLTARGWWDSTVSEGATRNIQLIGVKISS